MEKFDFKKINLTNKQILYYKHMPKVSIALIILCIIYGILMILAQLEFTFGWDYISGKIDEAIAIIKASGVKDLYKLFLSDKDKIIALVADISANTSVKASITKGYLVIYVPGTSDIFAKEQIFPKNGDVVQTSDNLTIAVAGLVSILGIAVALRKLRANA